MTLLEFNYQVTTFQDKLAVFAKSLTRDEEDAKDLLQETVLKAMKYRDKFVSPTNLKAWLFTIMKNTFINDYRRRKLVSFKNDDTPNEYLLNSKSSTLESQDAQLNAADIMAKINGLDEDYKVPFTMHVQGFKYKEISEQLELPIGTVKSRIFIARQQLMKELKDFR